MTPERYLVQRRLLPLVDDFLSVEEVASILRTSEVTAPFDLHVFASTDAASEVVFLPGAARPCLLVDLVGAELAYNLFSAGRLYETEERFSPARLILLRLATLKALACGDPVYTLGFFLPYLDEHCRASLALEPGQLVADMGSPTDLAAKYCVTAFLAAHEAAHVLCRDGALIDETVDQIAHTVRYALDGAAADSTVRAALQGLQTVLVSRPAAWPNLVEELTCDFSAIDAVIDALKVLQGSREERLAGFGAINAAIISTWVTYVVGDAVEAVIFDRPSDVAHSAELLTCRALLGCLHAANLWFAVIEENFHPAAELVGEVMSAFKDVDHFAIKAFNSIFARDNLRFETLRAAAQLELGLICPEALETAVIEQLRGGD